MTRIFCDRCGEEISHKFRTGGRSVHQTYPPAIDNPIVFDEPGTQYKVCLWVAAPLHLCKSCIVAVIEAQ